MRYSGESPGRRWLAVAIVIGVASSTSSGCYETTVRGRAEALPDAPPAEMSASGVPPSAGEPAPSVSPPAEPPPREPGEPPKAEPDPVPTLPADVALSFRPEPGFLFMQNSQFAGDLDGDGFDDVVLFALALDEQKLLGTLETAAYVFYGRSAPAAVLEAANADAVLRGKGVAITAPGWNPSAAIGDLNGDGLDDLVLGNMDGAYFVFGSERRLMGERDIADVAVRWTFPEVSPALSERPVRVVAAGDVQGDGLADVALIVSSDRMREYGAEGQVTTLSVDSTYLVLGREGDGWPAGVFQQDWAHTVFVMKDASVSGCSLYGAADLDGDGFGDLVLQADGLRRLVFGGVALPEGETEVTQAGEAFDLPGDWARALPDLDGDGSQELAWTHLLDSQQLNLSFGGPELDPTLRVVPTLVIDAAGMRLPATAVGDVDGDGAHELLVIAGDSAERPFGLYMIDVEESRGTGEIGLEWGRLLLTLPSGGASLEPTVGVGLDASGDLNGDGIADVLITTVVADPEPRGATEVRLLLGGTDLDGR